MMPQFGHFDSGRGKFWKLLQRNFRFITKGIRKLLHADEIMETEDVADLEDGEIDDDSLDEVYQPLERPSNVAPTTAPVVNGDEDVSDHEQHSEQSSDSDSSLRGSRIRIPKKKSIPRPAEPAKKKKYTIWCNDAADEILADKIVNCNVDRTQGRERDVESYDRKWVMQRHTKLDKRLKEAKIPERFKGRLGDSNKRTAGGSFVGERRKRVNKSTNDVITEMAPRELLPLTKGLADDPEDLAKDIANKLFEEKEDVILSVMKVLGSERTIGIFEETVLVEKNGGLLIMNGSRRRTPGGVFFFLAKTADGVTQEQLQEMFGDDRRKVARKIKKDRNRKRREAMGKEDYSTLLTKAGAAIMLRKQKEVDKSNDDDDDDDAGEGVKNPPPSPATDGDAAEPAMEEV